MDKKLPQIQLLKINRHLRWVKFRVEDNYMRGLQSDDEGEMTAEGIINKMLVGLKYKLLDTDDFFKKGSKYTKRYNFYYESNQSGIKYYTVYKRSYEVINE